MTDESGLTPQIGPRETIYKNRYQQLYKVEAAFDDFTKEYYVTDWGQRAGLLVARRNQVLLIRQYRLLIDGLSWEIPGGRVDDGETPEVAAARECFEETGLRCCNLRPLLSFLPGLDTLNNPTHVFYTDEFVEGGEDDFQVHEIIQCEWVSLERCLDMVFSQQILDSLTISALLAYHTLRMGQTQSSGVVADS